MNTSDILRFQEEMPSKELIRSVLSAINCIGTSHHWRLQKLEVVFELAKVQSTPNFWKVRFHIRQKKGSTLLHILYYRLFNNIHNVLKYITLYTRLEKGYEWDIPQSVQRYCLHHLLAKIRTRNNLFSKGEYLVNGIVRSINETDTKNWRNQKYANQVK